MKQHLSACWKDLKLFIKNFREVPLEEINHYQILVLKYLVDDKYEEKGKFEPLDAHIESEILMNAELNKQVQSAHALEELNRGNVENLTEGDSVLK